MLKLRTVLAVVTYLIVPSFAFAQDAAAVSAMNKVLSQRILTEMNLSVSCQAGQETDKQKISALERRVKELETKYESKQDELK